MEIALLTIRYYTLLIKMVVVNGVFDSTEAM